MTESTLVYFFIGNSFTQVSSTKKDYSYESLPEYYIDTLKFNSPKFSRTIFLLQDSEIEKNKHLQSEKIQLISLEKEVCIKDEYKEIEHLLETRWGRYKIEYFLYHTFLRIILLLVYLKHSAHKNIIHLEADNLVYSNNTDIFLKTFNSGEYGYSNVSFAQAAPGIMYFYDSTSASNLLKLFVKLLEKDEQQIFKATGVYLEYITDMDFLNFIYQYQKNFKMLPCLPFGQFSQNFDKFGMLFDPASYGQKLGGTNNGHAAGYIEPVHFVGRELSLKTIDIKFKNKPFVVYDGTEIPLYNLHMHNKKAIKDFIV